MEDRVVVLMPGDVGEQRASDRVVCPRQAVIDAGVQVEVAV